MFSRVLPEVTTPHGGTINKEDMAPWEVSNNRDPPPQTKLISLLITEAEVELEVGRHTLLVLSVGVEVNNPIFRK